MATSTVTNLSSLLQFINLEGVEDSEKHRLNDILSETEVQLPWQVEDPPEENEHCSTPDNTVTSLEDRQQLPPAFTPPMCYPPFTQVRGTLPRYSPTYPPPPLGMIPVPVPITTVIPVAPMQYIHRVCTPAYVPQVYSTTVPNRPPNATPGYITNNIASTAVHSSNYYNGIPIVVAQTRIPPKLYNKSTVTITEIPDEPVEAIQVSRNSFTEQNARRVAENGLVEQRVNNNAQFTGKSSATNAQRRASGNPVQLSTNNATLPVNATLTQPSGTELLQGIPLRHPDNYVQNGPAEPPMPVQNGFAKELKPETTPQPAAAVAAEQHAKLETINEVVNSQTAQNGEVQKEAPPPVQVVPARRSWASVCKKNVCDKEESSPKNVAGVAGVNNGGNAKLNGGKCPIRNARNDLFLDPVWYRIGESLLQFTIDFKTVNLQPRGLINRSNYCYINSILQALISCPPAFNLLKGLSNMLLLRNQEEKKFQTLHKMVQFVKEFSPYVQNRSNRNNIKKGQRVSVDCGVPFEPTYIYNILNGRSMNSFQVEDSQEDAEEYLGILLNALNDDMSDLMRYVRGEAPREEIVREEVTNESDNEWQVISKKNKSSVQRKPDFPKTPISDIFGGLLRCRIQKSGDQPTDTIQPFFTLQLNIAKVKSVKEALDALITKNPIEGVVSSRTKKEVEAYQQTTIEDLPPILILHLKCFDYKVNGCTKIVKPVEFPIDLRIDPRLLSTRQASPKLQYKLCGVVYHDGKEVTKGHYITDCYHEGYGSWLRYDDASIKVVPEEHVLKPQGSRVPYLLFYCQNEKK